MNDSLDVFLNKIAGELEGVDPSTITADVEFRQLENWNSMNALIILAFINVEYGKNYTAQQLSSCKTFRDVYNTLEK